MKSTEDEVVESDIQMIKMAPAPKVSDVKFVKPRIADDEVMAAAVEQPDNPNAEDDIAVSKTVIKKKIIKDGSMSIETTDIVARKKSIDKLLKKFNGYYQSE